jgi:hypothetical protein
MLGAGVDGYKSAVDAGIDYEQLMLGRDNWQAPGPLRQDHSGDRMGTAWIAEAYDDNDDDDDDDDDPDDPDESTASVFARRTAAPARAPVAAAPNWAALATQRQAEEPALTKPANPGRALILAVGFMVVVGTCVAGILADSKSEEPPQPQLRREPPRQATQPVPSPYELPEGEPPMPEPAPEFVTPRVLAGLFRYTGEVTGPEAFAGLALGERCEIYIEPNAGTLNCRWYVDCGQPRRRIYGGGDIGYSICELDDEGQPLRAHDEHDDSPDGAFLADLTTDPRMVIVEDRWLEPPVRVIISIDDGGLHSGSVPKTKQAPRDSQSEVQRRINRGESPTIEAGVLADW